MPKVVVLGSLNVDVAISVERHPKVGETIRATGVNTMPGGKGANQAVASAAAGARTVMIGAVGDDPQGDRYLRHLQQHGVDAAGVRRAAEPTGTATIIVDAAGNNSIVIDPGANGTVGEAELTELQRVLEPGDILTAMLEVPEETVIEAFAIAGRAGATSIFNPSPWSDRAAEIAAAADLVVVNTHEASTLGRSDDSVVMTFGEQGALWDGNFAAAPKVITIDTTGAGDVFTGTLCAQLAAGASRPHALETAVNAAAQAVTVFGAQRWSS